MKSEPAESRSEPDHDQPAETDGAESGQTQPLTIALPDGSESVSDAILSHREMLHAPGDHGLATAQEITHLSEALSSLSTDVEETADRYEQSQTDITELRETVARQNTEIRELRSVVDSLAEILGADTEWVTVDEDQ